MLVVDNSATFRTKLNKLHMFNLNKTKLIPKDKSIDNRSFFNVIISKH